MKFYLIVAKGSNKGMPIPISVDLFLMGADRMCQLRKSTLGTKHCALVTREKKVFVRDLDSGHETLVNGSAIPIGAEWPLHPGDRINVGNLEFMIQFRERALSQKDLEEWAVRCLDGHKEAEEDTGEHDASLQLKSAADAANSILNRLNTMKGIMKGRLRIGLDHGVTIVYFNDSMLVEESEVALVKKDLCDNLNKPNLRVLLDMKHVRRLSSGAVLMLGEFVHWLRPWGSTLAFCRIHPDLQSAVSMMDVENIRIFKDKKTALASRW